MISHTFSAGFVSILAVLFAGGSVFLENSEAGIPYPEINHTKSEALKVAVVGLVHDHVHWILGRDQIGDIDMVAIVEPNRQLAERYSQRYGYSMDIVYPSLEEMWEQVRPEAVTAFNSIFDHLEVVEFCAPKGIHVMVEKPLAVSLDHAEKMLALARKQRG